MLIMIFIKYLIYNIFLTFKICFIKYNYLNLYKNSLLGCLARFRLVDGGRS